MENILLDIAEKSAVEFKLGTVTAPAVSAMRSPQVAQPLMDLSLITLNIASPGILDKTEATEGKALMAVMFDYAIEVAPRIEGTETVVDVAALHAHVEFMQREFGGVDIAPDLITRLGQYAQMRINLEELAHKPAPENNEDQQH